MPLCDDLAAGWRRLPAARRTTLGVILGTGGLAAAGAGAEWLHPGALHVLTGAVTLASILCAGTPTPDPSTGLGRLYGALEFLAVNIGHAKDGNGNGGSGA